jgi:hypothetical protein
MTARLHWRTELDLHRKVEHGRSRPGKEVLSCWLLVPATVPQHCVCVESNVRAGAPFQPLQPWMGGDFNPFEKLDECPNVSTTTTSMASQTNPGTA